MNYPEIYERNNVVTLSVGKKILNEYKHLINWRANKKDSLLDIGCGPGSSPYNIILPILPPTFEKLMACDISEEMVKYAQKKYIHDKLSFCVLDIGDSNVEKYFPNGERFDHITSFFCLHWIPNQLLAMQNISKLLNDNGDCLLIIIADMDHYDAYEKLYKTGKWCEYMEDYKILQSPYHGNDNKKDDMINILQKTGFTNYKVDTIENSSFTLKGFKQCHDLMKSINAFLKRIPVDKQDECITDQIKLQFPDVSESDAENRSYEVKYSLLIVYARK